jgi:hypothetical protein
MLVTARESLIVPGLQPNGRPITLVDIPGFSRRASYDQRRGGACDVGLDELAACARASLGMPVVGIVQMDRHDRRTGKLLTRLLSHNVETDQAINNMLKLFGSGGASSTLGQYIALDTATAASVMSGSTINTASGAQTTIAVVSGGAASAVAGNASTSFIAAASHDGTAQNVVTPGANPDSVYGTGIIWSYGVPANVEYVAGTVSASSATSINITSYTVGGSKSHVAGDYIVAGPSTKDGSSATTPAGITYSPAQAATYTTTAGIGNRKAALSYLFPTSTPAASYTGIWIVTAVTWAANIGYAHVVASPQVINGSTTLTVTYTAIF